MSLQTDKGTDVIVQIMNCIHCGTQWLRSVVEDGVRVSQVKPSNFQAPRKISFTFRFKQHCFILDDVKLGELSNSSVLGDQNTLTPPIYFQGVKTHNRQDPHPC